MAVHIIIDGYNFIRNSDSLRALDRQDIQLGREALVDLLATYKRVRPHRITVVFDGTGAPEFSAARDRVKGITVRFSRSGETADAVIKRMAARERERALVVSSDRSIVRSACASRAAIIDTPEFEHRLQLAAAAGGAMEDTDSGGWVPTTRKKGPARRLPKRRRRDRTKIRKL
ncbi:MAG TPA: NYN domain-containing protein [Desulfobacterales bacterium]